MSQITYSGYRLVLLACVLLIALPAFAQVGLNTEAGVSGESSAEAGQSSGGGDNNSGVGVDMRSDANIKAGVSGTTTEVKGKGDINVGVGGQSSSDNSANKANHKESENENSAMISVSAKEVRGWDADKKQEFMATVKTQAEVKSDQDLEHFAQGVILSDENTKEIEASEKRVTVKYNVPAKFLGLFTSEIEQETTVSVDGDKQGRVKVNYPWHRIFYKVDKRVQEESVTEELSTQIDGEVLMTAEGEVFTPSAQASIVARVIAVLKSE